MEASFFDRHPHFKDALSIVVFIICVVIGTTLMNAFIFRSFNVSGSSMAPTLHTNDRLIVDRLPVTWAQLQGKTYTPERGQVIVFENPQFSARYDDRYLVKRVIGLPGERVVLQNGVFTVYNEEHPEGFNPDDTFSDKPATPISGEKNIVVPANELFVSGDNRVGSNSFDSRSGLGTVPLYDVVGPVSVRIFPFNQIRGL
jgi:signal peptidase I